MKHIAYESWLDYVQDNVEKETRKKYEAHLFHCDACHVAYVRAVEANATKFPALPPEFTDRVLDHITGHTELKQEGQENQSIYQKKLFHYLIAAVMTILLMSSGLFGQLSQLVGEFEEQSIDQKQSITEQLMAKASSFLPINEHKEEVK